LLIDVPEPPNQIFIVGRLLNYPSYPHFMLIHALFYTLAEMDGLVDFAVPFLLLFKLGLHEFLLNEISYPVLEYKPVKLA
jgi:hypothetical protein